jgi:hypothetical protein
MSGSQSLEECVAFILKGQLGLPQWVLLWIDTTENRNNPTVFRLTNSLTRCRALLEKLTLPQLTNEIHQIVKEFRSSLPHSQKPVLCPYQEPDQSSPYPNQFLKFQVVSFPPASPPKLCVNYSPLHPSYMLRPAHSSLFEQPNNICWEKIMKLPVMYFSPFHCYLVIFTPDTFLSTLFHVIWTKNCQKLTKEPAMSRRKGITSTWHILLLILRKPNGR